MLSLRPYQNDAATFVYERDRSMILAPVGAGKTAIALTAMRELLRDGHVTRWLVIAPKRVCSNVWPLEAPKWAPELTFDVCLGTPKQRLDALNGDANVVVINYDNLQWLAEQDLNFDGVVFDELTKLKNPSGARFKAFQKVVEPMRIRLGLTGSFTSNGLEDVFGQCKIVDRSLLGRSKGAFQQQYFREIRRGEYVERVPLPDALQQVMARIKPATFVLEPGEYKDKLPPCHFVPIKLDMDMDEYNEMKRNFVVELGSEVAVATTAAVVTQKLQQMAGGWCYTPNPVWFSDHKFDALDDLLAENQQANTLVIYNYKEELSELKRRYKHLVLLDDDRAIERWNDGAVRLMALHPKSAGHGLNLQHGGCHMVFLSLPWSLELFEQTVGRLHRSGQRRDVWVYMLMTRDTVDEQIAQALKEKNSVSKIALEALK